MMIRRPPACRVPPRRARFSSLTAWACAVITGVAPALSARAQTSSAERTTIEQLRATTMALLDALDRQQQQQQQRADLVAQQAIEQQRVTTMALIEVLVGQGLLPRDRAETLLRMAAGPVRTQAVPVAVPVAVLAPQPVPSFAPPAQVQAQVQPQAQAQPQSQSQLSPPAPLPLPVPSSAPALAAAAPPGALQWGAPPPAGATAPSSAIRVPYMSETARAQIREQVRNDVLTVVREENWANPRLLPPWVRGVNLYGDVRVRGQFENYPDDNFPADRFRDQTSSPAWSPDITNTSIDRNRLTLRARLGLGAKVSDDLSLGLRLSTGSTSGPASSSQTLGTGFNIASLVLDRAWLRWEPWQDLRLHAGRMSNPFFASDLLWADDLGFDGLALQAERTLGNGLFAFATAGAFALEEFNTDSRDKWLYGLQVGVDWSLGSNISWRTAVALYDFRNIEGVRERSPPPAGPLAGTQGYFSSQYPVSLRQKGNTLINLNDPTSTAAPTWGLASRFRPINLTSVLTVKPSAHIEAALSIDWVKNSAFDIADIQARAGVPLADLLRPKTTGLQVRGHVGSNQLASKGDWQVFAALRNFERDAWIDGFTDTTWNLGGTNYRGWTLGGHYAFDTRTSLGLRLTSTRNLDDGYRSAAAEATKSSAPLRVDVLQLDVNSRF